MKPTLNVAIEKANGKIRSWSLLPDKAIPMPKGFIWEEWAKSTPEGLSLWIVDKKSNKVRKSEKEIPEEHLKLMNKKPPTKKRSTQLMPPSNQVECPNCHHVFDPNQSNAAVKENNTQDSSVLSGTSGEYTWVIEVPKLPTGKPVTGDNYAKKLHDLLQRSSKFTGTPKELIERVSSVKSLASEEGSAFVSVVRKTDSETQWYTTGVPLIMLHASGRTKAVGSFSSHLLALGEEVTKTLIKKDKKGFEESIKNYRTAIHGNSLSGGNPVPDGDSGQVPSKLMFSMLSQGASMVARESKLNPSEIFTDQDKAQDVYQNTADQLPHVKKMEIRIVSGE